MGAATGAALDNPIDIDPATVAPEDWWYLADLVPLIFPPPPARESGIVVSKAKTSKVQCDVCRKYAGNPCEVCAAQSYRRVPERGPYVPAPMVPDAADESYRAPPGVLGERHAHEDSRWDDIRRITVDDLLAELVGVTGNVPSNLGFQLDRVKWRPKTVTRYERQNVDRLEALEVHKCQFAPSCRHPICRVMQPEGRVERPD
jgi:hypothetical protein